MVDEHFGLRQHIVNICLYCVPDHVDEQLVDHSLIRGLHIDKPKEHHSIGINVVVCKRLYVTLLFKNVG